MLRRRTVLLGIGLLAASCSAGGPRSAHDSTTTSRTPMLEALAPTPGATPPAPLLVAGPDGVASIDATGAVTLIRAEPAAIAVDDGAGGIVWQSFRGPDPQPPRPAYDTTIWWQPAGAAEPRALVTPDLGHSLSLHDIVEGALYYTRRSGSMPDDLVDMLVRLELASGQSHDVRQVGGWEWGSEPISVSTNLLALTESVHAGSRLRLFTPDGTEVDIAGNLPKETPDGCVRCPGQLELSPDGEMLAYVEVGYDERSRLISTEVIVADFATGAEQNRIRVQRPDQAWWPAALDLVERVVVVNRSNGDATAEPTNAWVMDLRSKTPRAFEAPVAGHARLVRAPLVVPASSA